VVEAIRVLRRGVDEEALEELGEAAHRQKRAEREERRRAERKESAAEPPKIEVLS